MVTRLFHQHEQNMTKTKTWALLGAITFMALPFHAKAQTSSNIFQLPDFKGGKAVWTIRAGIGFNNMVGSYKETQDRQWEHDKWDGDFKNSIGYDVTLGFSKSIGHHPLYWGMELGFMTRGYETSASWEHRSSSSVTGGYDYHGKFQDNRLMCHTVKFSPFTIGYRYTFCKRMAADVHLGAYASYDYVGNYKTDYTDHIISSSKYGHRNDKKTTSTKTKINDLDNMRKYDAGINLGVGYWFGKFNLDFSWQRGFIGIYEDGDEEVKIGKERLEKGNLFTNSFQLKLGYAF